MKLAIVLLAVAGLAIAVPAAAHVVEVTTAIPLSEVSDAADLQTALTNAVDRAKSEAIAFKPAVMGLTGMRVVGDQLLVGLLFADEDGKAMLDALREKRDDQQSRDPDDGGAASPDTGDIKL